MPSWCITSLELRIDLKYAGRVAACFPPLPILNLTTKRFQVLLFGCTASSHLVSGGNLNGGVKENTPHYGSRLP